MSISIARAKLSRNVKILDDIYNLFDCDSFYNADRPMNSHEEWSHAIDQYRAIIGQDLSIKSYGNDFQRKDVYRL